MCKKMKICKRGLNFVQVIDACGAIRVCSWMKNSYIGNLLESDLEQAYHSDLARKVRQPLIDGTYENCPIDNCPYLANGTIDQHLVEIDEIPNLPDTLYLAYEGLCNYNCTCCTSYMNMETTKHNYNNYQENYQRIEQKLLTILPHIKTISAHGRGELFASPRILKLLSKWRPLAPAQEIEVRLETNGSLFDEAHWKQIENLGQYRLRVAITVMSFNEPVYQYLSGVNYPIDKILENLQFVKTLRQQNIINELELATVLQEQNFREMPEFTRRCLEEFGADSVRIRPIVQGGRLNQYEQWFMNVRNPEHPYYQEYKKVMSDKIFQHPKVLLWSGALDSENTQLSDLVERNVNQLSDALDAERKITNLLYYIISTEQFAQKFKLYMERHDFTACGVWGLGKVGKSFLKCVDVQAAHIVKLFDQQLSGLEFKNMQIEQFSLQQVQQLDAMILTPIKNQQQMINALVGYKGTILTLEEIVNELR